MGHKTGFGSFLLQATVNLWQNEIERSQYFTKYQINFKVSLPKIGRNFCAWQFKKRNSFVSAERKSCKNPSSIYCRGHFASIYGRHCSKLVALAVFFSTETRRKFASNMFSMQFLLHLSKLYECTTQSKFLKCLPQLSRAVTGIKKSPRHKTFIP